jgi:hypothetical protein
MPPVNIPSLAAVTLDPSEARFDASASQDRPSRPVARVVQTWGRDFVYEFVARRFMERRAGDRSIPVAVLMRRRSRRAGTTRRRSIAVAGVIAAPLPSGFLLSRPQPPWARGKADRSLTLPALRGCNGREKRPGRCDERANGYDSWSCAEGCDIRFCCSRW